MVPSLSKWKFCVHADKRNLLQQMTYRLCGNQYGETSSTSEILYEVWCKIIYLYNYELCFNPCFTIIFFLIFCCNFSTASFMHCWGSRSRSFQRVHRSSFRQPYHRRKEFSIKERMSWTMRVSNEVWQRNWSGSSAN